ncbi:conserved hypothetical protein, secreted [Candidatus Magnetobacterium bavaricum]|uniref:Peptidase S74 domain-containing protein n=1 Tax=Candidatus Magnetobacterium bavaricum TaxID=29290 RepID=A0A0F3GKN6_9BACT|nr:conserved hypothetical protein, secreted [Candidatus Magnetobacterium bavaricum]
MRFRNTGLKKLVGANVAIVALLFLTLSAYAGSVPNVFTSGTVAKSSEVNANFTYLGERSWDKSGSNLYYNGGNVGIGTDNPGAKLHVAGTVRLYDEVSAQGLIFEPGVNNIAIHKLSNEAAPWKGSFTSFAGFTPTIADLLLLGYEGISFGTRKNGDVLGMRLTSNGNVGIGQTAPAYPLHMGSGAYVTTGGVWTNASSREYKKDIQSLTSEDAMLAFNKLEPVSFKYKTEDEQHIGFIAEDVPDIVATKDRKGLSPMDVVALLTKVVQEQQKMAQEQQKTIVELKEEVRALKEKSQ